MIKMINDGVISISNNFVYRCPLKLDDNYKVVILGLFYNNYSMHFGNMFKSRTVKKILPTINDEISAGKLAADYGYLTFEFKNENSNIFVPEFFNNFQLINALKEISYRDNFNFSLYNQFNGYDNNLADASSSEVSDFIKSIYSDLCFDAKRDFAGYSLDRKAKAIKLMK